MPWAWRAVQVQGSFLRGQAVLGPLLIGIGAWLVIEAPILGEHRPSRLGYALGGIGLVAGLLYSEWLRGTRLPFLP